MNDARRMVKGYELRERIGTGGFGAVYKAYQTTVGREVAVKVILPSLANKPDFVRRFENEAQTIARLEHLHIVPLYDYWREPDGAYLVMRWLRGGSLRDALQRGDVHNLARAALLLEQLSAGLNAAHQLHVIHRDLKPANILLDEDGNAYLADFGIATDLAAGSGSEFATAGSPDYLAPEQARGELVTPQTDQYSLGVVLYEALTGQHPFPGISSVERLYKHLSEPLPQIATLDPSAQDAVNAVIQRATAKNPAQRYESVLAMAADFELAIAPVVKPAARNVVEALTPREQEIMRFIMEGLSNKEIAARLFVTIATVKWYITQIYQKLGVRSRVQAIIRARELQFIPSVYTDHPAEPATLGSALSTDHFQPANPYKGLRPFQTADHEDYFGRDRLIRRLVGRLSESGEMSRFLAVIGPSGSGKSSVVNAGLVPALWRGALPGSERWFIANMVPGSRPLDELEVALARLATTPVGTIREHLRRDVYGLFRTANLVLPNDGSELVLVVDQLEEVFTLVKDEAVRSHFLQLLLQAISEPRSRVRVVVTLRADFYDRPLQYPAFGDLVRSRMETILPLSAKELEQAAVGPAERVGVSFEEGLLTELVEDMHYQAGALPLMQFALTELFERRQEHVLTRSAYQEIGGSVGALAQRAEALYQEFKPEDQEIVRQIFLRLVTIGEGSESTRRRVHRSELLALSPNTDVIDEVLDTFSAYRLLSLDHDPLTRSPTVEFAHEAVLREWSRLRDWLEVSLNDIRIHRQLSRASEEWHDAGHDASFLLRGARLDQLERWAGSADLALNSKEKAFLDLSMAHRLDEEVAQQERQAREMRLERRSRVVLRGLVAVLLTASIATSLLAAAAIGERNSSARSAELNQSLALASAAQAQLLDGDTSHALALARAATQIDAPPIFAQRVLYETAVAPGTEALLDGGTGWRWIAVVSPNKRLIALQEDEVRVAVWDAESHELVVRLDGNHPDGLGGTAFTPDNQHLLVGAWDDTLELWNLNTGEMEWSAVNPAGDPNSIAVSPDGLLAVVGSQFGVATLWDVHDGTYLGDLAGHNPDLQVQGTEFSPDGRLAASASEDGTVILWDIGNRVPVHRLVGHEDIVFSVSFSPDGRSLASSSFDKTVRVWDVETGALIRTFSGHTDYVFDVDWSPDGTRLLSASRDSTLILWEVLTGTPLRTYYDEAGRSLTVSFLDDSHALSGASSQAARQWALDDAREQWRHSVAQARIHSMALSPDQQYGALGIEDEIVLVSLETGEALRRLHYAGGAVTSLAFSPDTRLLIAGYDDSSVIVWDTETASEMRRLEGHTVLTVHNGPDFGSIIDLVVSSDGRHVLSGSEDKTMLVWDLATGQILHRFESCSGTINSGDFSPDGSLIVGGFGALSEPTRGICPEKEFTVHLWDAETGDLIRQFAGHEDAVTEVRFSPDGQWVLSGSVDETVRLWDVATGAEVQRYTGHSGGVTSIDWSEDGQHAAVGSADGTVRAWAIHAGELLRQWNMGEGPVGGVAFAVGASSIWTAGADGTLRLWSAMLKLEELLTWISLNRHVRDLTCSEERLYRLSVTCDELG